jgi:hypothetical protein
MRLLARSDFSPLIFQIYIIFNSRPVRGKIFQTALWFP